MFSFAFTLIGERNGRGRRQLFHHIYFLHEMGTVLSVLTASGLKFGLNYLRYSIIDKQIVR